MNSPVIVFKSLRRNNKGNHPHENPEWWIIAGISWSSKFSWEKDVVVIVEKDKRYRAKIDVPAGIVISDKIYWEKI